MRALLAGALLMSGAASAAQIEGTLELFSGGQALRATEAADAVVYYRPRQPVAAPPSAEPVVMTTRRKQFVPHTLAITAGTTVRFPNEDPILHNVFSRSPNNTFDAGLYGAGDGWAQKFDSPGLVKVFCNVHHSMYGYVLVLDTPFYTRPDAQGHFALAGVPNGDGDLVVFHDRGDPHRERISVVGDQALNIRIDLDQRKVPPHMNKFGKPYGRDEKTGY